MTSNVGSDVIQDYIAKGKPMNSCREEVMGILKGCVRPEFLNRIDEIIMFKPLTKDNIKNIVGLIISDLNRRLADRELKISLTDKAADFIVDQAYDPVYGARPLKRFIQKHIETLVGKAILEGRAKDGDSVVIDVNDGTLVINQ
ncbi:MAG: type VI secretion system ATPase TssH, partial [Lachnospiraceae bacterium]|nr:type VI secretion system ATPase TssH [Lachnospiraceae bacterium]